MLSLFRWGWRGSVVSVWKAPTLSYTYVASPGFSPRNQFARSGDGERTAPGRRPISGWQSQHAPSNRVRDYDFLTSFSTVDSSQKNNDKLKLVQIDSFDLLDWFDWRVYRNSAAYRGKKYLRQQVRVITLPFFWFYWLRVTWLFMNVKYIFFYIQ